MPCGGCSVLLVVNPDKKNDTCEEGGIPQNFFLAFIDEIEIQLCKKLLKWANKKQNFNIYNVAFF